eukprot:3806417-Alexandrium_andersonii.AAC.1
MACITRLTRRWSDATGDGVILRHLVEADWPGYFDWAERRADLAVERPPWPRPSAAGPRRSWPPSGYWPTSGTSSRCRSW